MNIVNVEYVAYPSRLGPMVLVVALTRDDVGQFAAYAAIDRDLSMPEPGRNVRQSAWAAYSGAKLSHAECVRYFPFIKAKEYRA